MRNRSQLRQVERTSCAILLLAATVLGCGRNDGTQPAPPTTTSEPAAPTPTPAPSPTPSPSPTPAQPAQPTTKPQADEPPHHRPPAGAHVRVIHPLSADMELCIEMYSMCTGSGNRKCTSAPLHIECGDAAELPGSPEHEWLDCACP